MKGVQLFTHSIRQVSNNLGPALRISGVLYLVQVAASLVLGASLMFDSQATASAMQAGDFPWFGFVVVILVALVTSLWIAVGWHRYVLRLELPAGIVPALHPDRMLAYFGRSILLGIVLLLIGMVIGLVVGLVLLPIIGRSPGMGTGFLFVVLIYVPVVVISYRLSLSLPGAALGEPMGFGASWEATRGGGRRYPCAGHPVGGHGGGDRPAAGLDFPEPDDPGHGLATGVVLGIPDGRHQRPDHAVWPLRRTPSAGLILRMPTGSAMRTP